MSETTSHPQNSRIDSLLAVLADEERRTIIAHLRDTPSATATLDGITAALATTTDLGQERARLHLHHGHLPTLADAGLITYDMDTYTIEYHGHPALAPLLEALSDSDPTPHH